MKSSDMLTILGYVVVAPHMNPLLAGILGLIAFSVSIILRGMDR